MYTTCTFCTRDLGANRVVEHFQVGRRLAFDAAKGRLWVVCRRCERWNLTPLEERWEAVEECERLFRDTRVRASTENIGLARHPEGLELVRIGRPLRPEFAAWRYGDQFGRRRRRRLVAGGGVAAGLGVLVVGGWAAGVLSGGLLMGVGQVVQLWAASRPAARVRLPGGKVVELPDHSLQQVRLVETDDEQRWGLEVRDGIFARAVHPERYPDSITVHLAGEEARSYGRLLLPAINAGGAGEKWVREAVRRIEEAGDPVRFLARAPESWTAGTAGVLHRMPVATRLAIEMALHEEEEMRAMQGELWRLERAWKAAEEVAAIADGLTVPEGMDSELERLRDDAAGADRQD